MTDIPVLERCGPLLSRYDVLLCDVWGVVHDGVRAYADAAEALTRFRSGGGRVILLSNSPQPSTTVVHVLDGKGVRRDIADAIITSGDITRAHALERGYTRVHHIGPDRDLALFAGTPMRRVPLPDAQAILCTGLVDDVNETGETYRPLLTTAHALNLPFICANPDLVVDVGGVRLPCAGTLAAIYEAMGGSVYWAGKPHAAAYDAAKAMLRTIEPHRSRMRILAIGDALRTDIAGAAHAGLDALFIAQGIHCDEVVIGRRIDPDRLQRLFALSPPEITATVRGAALGLAW